MAPRRASVFPVVKGQAIPAAAVNLLSAHFIFRVSLG